MSYVFVNYHVFDAALYSWMVGSCTISQSTSSHRLLAMLCEKKESQATIEDIEGWMTAFHLFFFAKVFSIIDQKNS